MASIGETVHIIEKPHIIDEQGKLVKQSDFYIVDDTNTEVPVGTTIRFSQGYSVRQRIGLMCGWGEPPVNFWTAKIARQSIEGKEYNGILVPGRRDDIYPRFSHFIPLNSIRYASPAIIRALPK
jgi:hypothetical protein